MSTVRQFLRRRLDGHSLALAGVMAAGLLSVAESIAGLLRGVEAALLAEMTLTGGAAAWLAAATRLRGRWAAVLLPAAGFAHTGWRVGGLGAALGQVARATARVVWLWILHPREGPPSTGHLQAAVQSLASQTGVVVGRLGNWLGALFQARPEFDPLASALIWGLLLWCLGAWAAWALRRGARPLLGMLPPLAVLAYTSFYTGSRANALLLPLAALLLLMIYGHHAARTRGWATKRLTVAHGLGARLTLAAVPICIGLVASAAIAPSLSLDRAVRWAQRLSGQPQTQEGSLGDSLGLEQVPQYESPLYRARAPGLPNRHLIGSGDELSEQQVMTVSIFNLPIEGPPPSYYWRALTYDRYARGGWVTSSTRTWSYAPGEPTEIEPAPGQRLIRQKVRSLNQGQRLAFATGLLVTTDRDYEVAWRTTRQDAFAATLDAEIYEARSLVPEVTEAELRSAGNDYPEWVRQRYLGLPEDIPDRVSALGRDLTATAPTPYDRALAITNYLRNIPYDLDVALPPDDRDVVDWFLFDLQRGYCDYYASAMVVLARAAGLPARFVVGYYTGSREQTEGTYRYVVTAADAHSWVEVYFPGYGWIEFDPTAGRPPINRPAQRLEPEPTSSPSLEPRARPGAGLGRLGTLALRWTGILLAVGVAMLAASQAYDIWQLRRLGSRQAIGMLYRRLERLAMRLGASQGPNFTPYELGSSLNNWLRRRSRGRLGRLLEPSHDDVAELIERSVLAAYGRRPMEPGETMAVWRRWWNLAPRLCLVALLGRLRLLTE